MTWCVIEAGGLPWMGAATRPSTGRRSIRPVLLAQLVVQAEDQDRGDPLPHELGLLLAAQQLQRQGKADRADGQAQVGPRRDLARVTLDLLGHVTLAVLVGNDPATCRVI